MELNVLVILDILSFDMWMKPEHILSGQLNFFFESIVPKHTRHLINQNQITYVHCLVKRFLFQNFNNTIY